MVNIQTKERVADIRKFNSDSKTLPRATVVTTDFETRFRKITPFNSAPMNGKSGMTQMKSIILASPSFGLIRSSHGA